MNLIVDINPYLTRSYRISQFSSNTGIVAENYETSINTNAINYSRIFNMFDVESKIFTYLGGFIGSNYLSILEGENRNLAILKLRDSTLEKVQIYDGIRELNIFTRAPRITNDEINDIYESFYKEAEKNKYIILTDSSDSQYEEEFYMNFINIANKINIKTAISTNKDNIKNIVKQLPSVILVDKEGLETLFNKEFNFNWEINKAITELLETGISNILYYSKKGMLQLHYGTNIYKTNGEGFEYKEENKEKILAGYLAALNKNYDSNMSLQIALAASSLELKKETLNRDASEIKAKIKNIEIEKINVTK